MAILKEILLALAGSFVMFKIASAIYPRCFPDRPWRWQGLLFVAGLLLTFITSRFNPSLLAASVSAWLTVAITLGLQFPGNIVEVMYYERDHKRWTKKGAIAAAFGVVVGWGLGYTKFVSL